MYTSILYVYIYIINIYIYIYVYIYIHIHILNLYNYHSWDARLARSLHVSCAVAAMQFRKGIHHQQRFAWLGVKWVCVSGLNPHRQKF